MILMEIGMFGFNFQRKKYKNDDGVMFAGVSTKSAHCLMDVESLLHQNASFQVVCCGTFDLNHLLQFRYCIWPY